MPLSTQQGGKKPSSLSWRKNRIVCIPYIYSDLLMTMQSQWSDNMCRYLQTRWFSNQPGPWRSRCLLACYLQQFLYLRTLVWSRKPIRKLQQSNRRRMPKQLEPPSVISDETRHIPPHTPLAPMEVDTFQAFFSRTPTCPVLESKKSGWPLSRRPWFKRLWWTCGYPVASESIRIRTHSNWTLWS